MYYAAVNSDRYTFCLTVPKPERKLLVLWLDFFFRVEQGVEHRPVRVDRTSSKSRSNWDNIIFEYALLLDFLGRVEPSSRAWSSSARSTFLLDRTKSSHNTKNC